jgi:exodeoxyribonuclease VII large subunit
MNPVSVSKLTTHIVLLFENDATLRDVSVLGEVSNWKRAASGHIYFNLKDAGATLSAVMWKSSANAHTWLPREGDQIVAHGYVGVYPERGAYQLYANRIQPAGRGQLYAEFERLKAKLQQERLFEQERKRPIPVQPRRIGVITSRDAAALRDILRVLAMRWPLVEVIVFSTLVQGGEAPGQIVAALERAAAYSERIAPLETLILARGGGSIEDLWAFNDERVAYAIASSPLPVIAGVGHETDFTIADFVADLRAPTPSAAAAAVAPDRAEVRTRLMNAAAAMGQGLLERIGRERREVEAAHQRLARAHPQRLIDVRRQSMDDRLRRLDAAMRLRLSRARERTDATAQRLEALSPLQVLARGYSIVQRNDGKVITGPSQTKPGEPLTVRAAGGAYAVVVRDAPGQA